MNKTILSGHLVRDPEVKETQTGTQITSFTLAVNRKFAKENQQQADFIRVTAFGKLAEIMGKYLSKGSHILISGRIQTGSYDNKDGQKVYTTDVIAEEMEFLDTKKKDDTTEKVAEVFPGAEETSIPF